MIGFLLYFQKIRFNTSILFLCFSIYGLAQNTITDSLNFLLLNMDNDSAKAEVYIDLSKAYYFGPNAMNAAQKALEFSLHTNQPDLVSRAYVELGWSYYSSEFIDSSVYYADKALSVLEYNSSHQAYTDSYALRALLFMEFGQYEEADQMYKKAAKSAAASRVIKDQAKIANNLGVLYHRLGNYEASLEELYKSLEWSEAISEDIYIGRAYYNIGRDYYAMDNYRKAYDWLIKSVKKRSEIRYYNGVAEGLYTMAEMFFSMSNSDLKKSMLKDLENDGYDNAFELLDRAENLPTLEGNDIIKRKVENIRIIGYASIGKYDIAYNRLVKYKRLNDSLSLNENNLEAIANLKVKYENDLLEAQNELKESEIYRRKILQYFLGAFAFLLFGLLLFSIQFFRQKKVLAQLKHEKEIEEKIIQVDRLNARISDLLDNSQQLDLRPLSEINEILQNPLSDKEYEVLLSIAKGLTNKEIGSEQYISENTVKFHLKNIYSKLDVGNRREAVRKIASLV